MSTEITIPYITADIARFGQPKTRLKIPSLISAVPTVKHDSSIVFFDGARPVEYRGPNVSETIDITIRYGRQDLPQLVALDALLSASRQAQDARLILRPLNRTAGFEPPRIGVVPTWTRPRIAGQVHDLTFTFLVTSAAVTE